MTSRAVAAIRHPRMEVGFDIYGFHDISAFNPEGKQRNMGSREPIHRDGAFYSHAKHLDIRSIG